MPGPSETLTPEDAARETIAYLRENADPARAEKLQRYFKDPVDSYGVHWPPFKEWQAAFHARLAEQWTVREATEFCELMLEDRHMESRGTGFQAVALFVNEASPELLGTARRWLDEDCDNWGLVDNLAPSVVSPLLRNHPELIPAVMSWTDSPNQWVRRAAAVAFVDLVTDDRFLDPAYEVATRLLDEREDLVQKAVGWLLREAGKVDRDRLERYLLEHGPHVPRTTLRYAVEKYPKADRQRILEATRRAGAS